MNFVVSQYRLLAMRERERFVMIAGLRYSCMLYNNNARRISDRAGLGLDGSCGWLPGGEGEEVEEGRWGWWCRCVAWWYSSLAGWLLG